MGCPLTMCGIAGAFNISPSELQPGKAQKVLQNRGPDGSGFFAENSVTFIHTRLSVIDLSVHAAQPMVSSCGRYVIVFNGEIYNFQDLRRQIESSYEFTSKSDTEVVLAYYSKFGSKVLNYLRGMFAFVIWDKAKNLLFEIGRASCRERVCLAV